MLRESSTSTARKLRCGSTARTTRTGPQQADEQDGDRGEAQAEQDQAGARRGPGRAGPAVRPTRRAPRPRGPPARRAIAGQGGLNASSPWAKITGRYLNARPNSRSSKDTSSRRPVRSRHESNTAGRRPVSLIPLEAQLALELASRGYTDARVLAGYTIDACHDCASLTLSARSIAFTRARACRRSSAWTVALRHRGRAGRAGRPRPRTPQARAAQREGRAGAGRRRAAFFRDRARGDRARQASRRGVAGAGARRGRPGRRRDSRPPRDRPRAVRRRPRAARAGRRRRSPARRGGARARACCSASSAARPTRRGRCDAARERRARQRHRRRPAARRACGPRARPGANGQLALPRRVRRAQERPGRQHGLGPAVPREAHAGRGREVVPHRRPGRRRLGAGPRRPGARAGGRGPGRRRGGRRPRPRRSTRRSSTRTCSSPRPRSTTTSPPTAKASIDRVLADQPAQPRGAHAARGHRLGCRARRRSTRPRSPARSRVNPTRGDTYRVVAAHAARKYRFDEAVALGPQGDRARARRTSRPTPSSGMNLLRAGDGSARRAACSTPRSAAIPYDLVTLNLLRVLDTLDGFETQKSGVATIRMHPDEAPVLGLYAGPLAARALAEMRGRYGIDPKRRRHDPDLPEARRLRRPHDRPHGDGRRARRQLRLGGHPGLAARAQAGRRSTGRRRMWHELAHVFTLQLSNQRVPRWVTEGISVYEEGLVDPSWSRDSRAGVRAGVRPGHAC